MAAAGASAVPDFAEWATGRGIVGLAHVDIHEFPPAEGGRGLRARTAISRGTPVVTVPLASCWSAANARASAIGAALPADIREDDAIALHMLYEKLVVGSSSPWAPHLAQLAEDPPYTTLFFTEAELDALIGSDVYAYTVALRDQIRRDYGLLAQAVFVAAPALFPLHLFTVDQYRWALATLWSRSMDVVVGGAQVRILAPLADMLNTRPGTPVCHDVVGDALQVIAGDDTAAGEQLFIGYGPVPNSKLLRFYGFVLEGNPFDGVEVQLAIAETAPLYREKVKAYAAAGINLAVPFLLTSFEPLPPRLLTAVRIQRADESERALLPLAVQGGGISPSNERIMREALEEALRAMLACNPDALATDLELWRGREAMPAPLRAALVVRLAQKRILLTAISSLEKIRRASAWISQ
eukprot:c5756_g1_i1.p1 GENE.c5756_g1_i1~~c5756_g1_i1.p1  ORF type:complete len:422 (+),score=67.56 c5756_g1_i1:35-1267(+)